MSAQMTEHQAELVDVQRGMRAAEQAAKKPRMTAKRIAALLKEQFDAGYSSGHVDGWKECQQMHVTQKPRHGNPFIEFGAGVVVGLAAGLWMFFH